MNGSIVEADVAKRLDMHSLNAARIDGESFGVLQKSSQALIGRRFTSLGGDVFRESIRRVGKVA